MPLYQPTAEELQALVEDAKTRAGDDAALADSYLFHALYHHKDGLYPRRGRKAEWKLEAGEWVRYRRNLSTREWIEAFFPIRTKAGLIVKMVMNPGQRRLWAKVLRMQRAGVPVRILILKARKIGFCVSPTTPVLTADMRWVPIDSLHPGDEIVGVDETIPGGKGACRRMRRSIVEAKREIVSRALRVVTDHGEIVVTPEHRLLAKQRNGLMQQWREAKDFKVGDRLRRIATPWAPGSFEDGWFGGMIDGEGHVRRSSLAITQKPGAVLDAAEQYLSSRGYTYHIQKQGSGRGFALKSGEIAEKASQIVIHRMDEMMRCIGQSRPIRYVNGTWWEGKEFPGKRIGAQWDTIISIEEMPEQRMVDIQTSTKTFIANGIVSHNSSEVQAIMYEGILRGEHVRGLIVADKHETSQVLLQIASLARTTMEKTVDVAGRPVPWNFKLTSKASYSIAWDRPINGEIKITSAETDSPGRGMTPTMIHESEVAWFKDAAATEASVMSALPSLPGTMAFKESTANTDTGKFRDDFWDAWKHRETPIHARQSPWDAMFFAWYEDPDYAWTRSYGMGRPLPASMSKEILDTLTKEEEWLLQQKYLRRWAPTDEWEQYRVWDKWRLVIQDGKIVGKERDQTGVKMAKGVLTWRRKGVGMQPVTVDQLAWRRLKIVDADFGGDMDLFNREMPAKPEDAFMASGSPVFDPKTLNQYIDKLPGYPPLFRGYVSDDDTDTEGGAVAV